MEFIFALKQNVGAPSVSLVKEGDLVQRGQLIATKPAGALGTYLYSSIDGKVKSITESQIIIEELNTDFSKYIPLKKKLPGELIEEAGIVGLGGAGFPTSVKLNVDFRGHGTVIVNAAECEPILSHNIERIEKDSEKILKGLETVMDLVHASSGIIAIKELHTKAIVTLAKNISDKRISIFKLENIYPMGEERALIREILGILLSPEQLPLEASAVVTNAETLLRVYEAVELKKPLIDKDMTVAGKLKEDASVHILKDIPVGMKVSDVLAKVGGTGSEYGELIMGGPFTGKRTFPDAPIVKTTGGIIAAEEFLPAPDKIGLLVCACGADKERLTEQAISMGADVVGVEYCKQTKEVKTSRKCENPGRCPGQVQKVMNLKKAGAKALLISNCTDCTNTVMSCAPQLKLPVYHCTDGALRAVNYKLIRRFHKES